MENQERLSVYNCNEYLTSSLSTTGYYDELGQIMLIEPLDNVEEHLDLEFLQIGRPGVNGIGFGYRKGYTGIWAYYPLENEFILMFSTLAEFLEKWDSNQLSL